MEGPATVEKTSIDANGNERCDNCGQLMDDCPCKRSESGDLVTAWDDREAELFRRLRFGQLPPPVNPADMVASVDTRRLQPEDEDEDRRFWYGGGA